MLSQAHVSAALPASDLDRAKAFYTEKLGLPEPQAFEGEALLFESGGDRFMVYRSGGQPSGTHTQMGWDVQDVEAEVLDLRGRGVVFEEYDMPGVKTENGIATYEGGKSAWFKDSEGNVLAISSMSD